LNHRRHPGRYGNRHDRQGDHWGFGNLRNLGLGMTGALVGGVLFRVSRLFPNLDKFSVSMRDLISALIGSALVLLILRVWQRLPSAAKAA
jgi:uncharacterized membrane protein YeaQ/YmgE (transglycosylase-associated protein family)